MTFALTLACAVLLAAPQRAAPETYGLPDGARILEVQPLNSGAHPNRSLVLWMLTPTDNPRNSQDDPYTCPDSTRGSYYSGPARVSLLDGKRVVDTLEIKAEDESGAIDLPYRIQSGLYYTVEGVAKGKEGKPTIMQLRDITGDGKPFEFALFDAEACMGLGTTLIGYSEARDRLVQYPVELTVDVTTGAGKQASTETHYWVDYLFDKKPVAPGLWRYSIDYRGRGGTLDAYEVRYDAQAEKFTGTLVSKE